jgi:LPPG:FO 2-phospho-L-lactate transferase
MAALEALGEAPWFRLGDRDLATHLARTGRLAAGERPTEIAARLRAAFRVPATILPMTDDRVRTQVRTDDAWLPFQDYFVRLRQAPDVREVRFDGIDAADPSPEVGAAISAAAAIVVAPSNPIVSIGPILALPGLQEAIAERRAAGVPVVAVSPIVGGRALKGPADRMLASLGHEVSALGVARLLAHVATTFVLDMADADLAPAVEALGLDAIVTDSIMGDDAGRARLGGTILDAIAGRPGGRTR